MRVIERVFISLVLVAGLSAAASAQKDQKPPPKEKPPVVKPQPKPPPDNSNKGRHGNGEAAVLWKRHEDAA